MVSMSDNVCGERPLSALLSHFLCSPQPNPSYSLSLSLSLSLCISSAVLSDLTVLYSSGNDTSSFLSVVPLLLFSVKSLLIPAPTISPSHPFLHLVHQTRHAYGSTARRVAFGAEIIECQNRIGIVRTHNNADFSGSASFTTLLTPSLSSASMDYSSDLDTQSAGSLFHDKSNNTLGSLIGISSIFELSRRSTRTRMVEPFSYNKKNHKQKPWLFSLCSRLTTDAVTVNGGDNVPSHGHYLEEERRAANASTCRKRTFAYPYGVNNFSPVRDSSSLFLGDQVAAPECAATMEGEEGGREPSRALLGQSMDMEDC